jgi:hypothetical protein
LLGIGAWARPLLPMGDVFLFRGCFAYSRWCGGGSNVVYAVGFGKESLFGSLSTSSMVRAEGMFCRERRGGEIGDVGSDLGFLRIRVGE